MSQPPRVPVAPWGAFYARVFGITVVAALGYLTWLVVSPYVSSMLWAALLAFMLEPVRAAVAARWKSDVAAAAVVTALAALVVIGPVGVFGFVFADQASALLHDFNARSAGGKMPLLDTLVSVAPVDAVLTQVEQAFSLSRAQVMARAGALSQDVLQRLAAASGGLLVSALASVVQVVLMLVFLFFTLRDGRQYVALAVRLVPIDPAHTAELVNGVAGVTRAVVWGTLVTALVQGTLLGAGFALAGLPSPVVFGGVAALASLIPFVGTALLWVPAVVTLFLQGHPGTAVFLLGWCGILVAGSDNVIKPLVVSGNSNASTLLVLLGVLGGVPAFGPTGLFLGPVLLALVASVLRYIDVVGLGNLPTLAAAPEVAPRPSGAAASEGGVSSVGATSAAETPTRPSTSGAPGAG